MRCANCNAELAGQSKFCRRCGSPVAASNHPSGIARVCSGCGSQLRPGAKFCAKCGTSMGSTQAGPAAASVLRLCGHCGAELGPGGKFCNVCGTPTVLPSAVPSPHGPVIAPPAMTPASSPATDTRAEPELTPTPAMPPAVSNPVISRPLPKERAREVAPVSSSTQPAYSGISIQASGGHGPASPPVRAEKPIAAKTISWQTPMLPGTLPKPSSQRQGSGRTTTRSRPTPVLVWGGIIGCLLVVAVVAVVFLRSSHPTVPDSQIEQSIRMQFATDPALRQCTIGVKSQDSVVTLAGYINSDSDRPNASRIALQQRGVRRVVDYLALTPKFEIPTGPVTTGGTSQESVPSAGNSETANASTADEQNTGAVEASSPGLRKPNAGRGNNRPADDSSLIARLRSTVVDRGYDPADQQTWVIQADANGNKLFIQHAVCKDSSDGRCQKLFIAFNDRFLGTDTFQPSWAVHDVVQQGTGRFTALYEDFSDMRRVPPSTKVTYVWDGKRISASATPPTRPGAP